MSSALELAESTMTDDVHSAACGCFKFGSPHVPLTSATEPNPKRILTARQDTESVTLGFSDTSFTVKSIKPNRTGTCKYATTVYHVIWAELLDDTLTVSFIDKKKKASAVCIKAQLLGSTKEEAVEWVEDLLNVAYKDVKRNKKLKVFVNPFSGKGRSTKLFNRVVKQIFDYGKCTLDVTFTTHQRHATEVAKEMSLDYDAIVTLSGDGLIYEILNGFAEHENPREAFAIPFAPVPTGSGNGCCISLTGVKDGLDPALAALNAIKGKYMRADLCSVTQNGRRTISYMSVSMGLAADVDLGTDNLRWMGDTRFVYGFFCNVIRQRPSPIKISLKVSERDKFKMQENYQSAWHKQDEDRKTCWDDLDPSEKLPPLKHSETDTDGWEDIDFPVLYFYSGLLPYASRDLLQWPLALPNDGLIDVTVQEMTSMSSMVGLMTAAANGSPYWSKTQHYFKVHAYRIKTNDAELLAIDGENVPCTDFQVEVHKGMGAFLSPSGRYEVYFNLPAPTPSTK